MTVSVSGVRNDREVTFELGKPLPPDVRETWEALIRNDQRVGLQWWREVPSFTEPAGFVAAAIACLDRVEKVEGFEVPQPRPGVLY